MHQISERCQLAPQQAAWLLHHGAGRDSQQRCLLWSRLAALTLPCSLPSRGCRHRRFDRVGPSRGSQLVFYPRDARVQLTLAWLFKVGTVILQLVYKTVWGLPTHLHIHAWLLACSDDHTLIVHVLVFLVLTMMCLFLYSVLLPCKPFRVELICFVRVLKTIKIHHTGHNFIDILIVIMAVSRFLGVGQSLMLCAHIHTPRKEKFMLLQTRVYAKHYGATLAWLTHFVPLARALTAVWNLTLIVCFVISLMLGWPSTSKNRASMVLGVMAMSTSVLVQGHLVTSSWTARSSSISLVFASGYLIPCLSFLVISVTFAVFSVVLWYCPCYVLPCFALSPNQSRTDLLSHIFQKNKNSSHIQLDCNQTSLDV